jgi:hypothetical protein
LAFRLIPESPRWLLSQNNSTKAKEIIEAIAKENKKTLYKNIEVRNVSGHTSLKRHY